MDTCSIAGGVAQSFWDPPTHTHFNFVPNRGQIPRAQRRGRLEDGPFAFVPLGVEATTPTKAKRLLSSDAVRSAMSTCEIHLSILFYILSIPMCHSPVQSIIIYVILFFLHFCRVRASYDLLHTNCTNLPIPGGHDGRHLWCIYSQDALPRSLGHNLWHFISRTCQCLGDKRVC